MPMPVAYFSIATNNSLAVMALTDKADISVLNSVIFHSLYSMQ
jgi:hypothetical protein